MKKKAIVTTLLSLFVGIAIFAVVLGKSGFENVITPFKSFSPIYLAPFMLTSFAIGVMTVYRWSTILKHMGCKVPIWNLFMYRAVSFAIGYITPTSRLGGEPIRAMMLSHDQNIPIDKAYAAIIMDRIVDFTGAAVFLLVALFSLVVYKFPLKIVFFMVALIIGALIAFYILYSRLLKRRALFSKPFEIKLLRRFNILKKLGEHIKQIEQYSGDFLRSKKYISSLVIISVVMWVLFITEFKLALLMIGHNAAILQLFVAMLSSEL